MINKAEVYTDFQGFTALRKEAREESPEAIKKVAKQFEALFVQMMMKSMRDAVPDGGLFGSDQQRMYQDMFDKQLSMNISSGRGIGLAAVIERQISRSEPDVSAKSDLNEYFRNPVFTSRPAAEVSAIHHPYEARGIKPTSNGLWQEPEQFVNDLWPHAIRAADQLGVDPEVLIAQSALETGWGQYMRPKENGQNSFSLFGIKADQRWQGERVSVSTLEFRQGAMQREQAQFRAYGSVGEAFEDYVDFIQSNPRYRQALENGFNPEAYARELQRAGYATDPDYASKINRVRNSELLQTRVSELKNSTKVPLT